MKLTRKTLVKCPPKEVFDLETISENHNFCLGNGVVVHNSKDISDAVAGVIQNLYDNLDKASQLSNKYKLATHSEFIKERATKDTDKFQNMLADLY